MFYVLAYVIGSISGSIATAFVLHRVSLRSEKSLTPLYTQQYVEPSMIHYESQYYH